VSEELVICYSRTSLSNLVTGENSYGTPLFVLFVPFFFQVIETRSLEAAYFLPETIFKDKCK